MGGAETREGFRRHTAVGALAGGGRTLTLCSEGRIGAWKAGGGASLQVTGNDRGKGYWAPVTQALRGSTQAEVGGGGRGHRTCEQGLGRGETFCPAAPWLALPGRWGAYLWAVEEERRGGGGAPQSAGSGRALPRHCGRGLLRWGDGGDRKQAWVQRRGCGCGGRRVSHLLWEVTF